MKKVFLSMLAVAALAACSNDDNNVNDGPVPIRLGSGIDMEVVSKAPINPDENGTTTFTASIVGWEGETQPTLTTPAAWTNSIDVKASTQKQAVTWKEGTEYYNQDETVNTYMIAWHPTGTLEGTRVTFTNNGTQDAMLSQVISGNKETTEAPVLNFAHKSAQIFFKVKTDETEFTDGELSYLTSISVKNVKVVTGFDLSTMTTVNSEATTVNVPVTTNLTIKNEVADAGDGIMIVPEGNEITIDVVAAGVTYENQKVELLPSGNIEAGKSYIVTLTFTRERIVVMATVEEWVKGGDAGIDLI